MGLIFIFFEFESVDEFETKLKTMIAPFIMALAHAGGSRFMQKMRVDNLVTHPL